MVSFEGVILEQWWRKTDTGGKYDIGTLYA